MLLFGPPTDFLDEVKLLLSTDFECKDLGNAHFLLGIELRMLTGGGIELNQHAYIEKILKRYRMNDCNTIGTPLEEHSHLVKGTEEEQIDHPALYQSLIGSLMYFVIGTRPDLAHTISFLSQFSSCPTQAHLTAALRVLRYIKTTAHWNLLYPPKRPLNLEGYADASYGSNLSDRRSYSGYIFRLGDCAISWCSSKQTSVAVSTTEAEYVALSLAARQLTWLQYGLEGTHQNVDSTLRCDNNGSLRLAENPRIHGRSKHIDIHYHYVREKFEKGDFNLVRIDSKRNLADLLTKPLGKIAHHRLAGHIRHAKRGEVLKHEELET
jgi:hypothetical protein